MAMKAMATTSLTCLEVSMGQLLDLMELESEVWSVESRLDYLLLLTAVEAWT